IASSTAITSDNRAMTTIRPFMDQIVAGPSDHLAPRYAQITMLLPRSRAALPADGNASRSFRWQHIDQLDIEYLGQGDEGSESRIGRLARIRLALLQLPVREG